MPENNELEKTLWAAADKLRSNMDAAEYKHIVLGLIFLKYISDAFNDLYEQLTAGEGEFEGADPEDADEYLAHNIFFVPELARWRYLQDRAKQPEIGKWLDEAMDAIEKINPSLKGVLPKIYADPELNKQRLGELIDLIGTIGFNQSGHQAKDLLGRVYEYFLGQFAGAEGGTYYYYSFPKNKMNDWLRTEYQKRHNAPPDFFVAGGFSAAAAVVAGVTKAGGTDTEKLIAAMEGLQFPSAFGAATYRAIDHQSTLGAFVGKTALKDGKGVMVDWRYADGAKYLPPDDVVKTLRPAG